MTRSTAMISAGVALLVVHLAAGAVPLGFSVDLMQQAPDTRAGLAPSSSGIGLSHRVPQRAGVLFGSMKVSDEPVVDSLQLWLPEYVRIGNFYSMRVSRWLDTSRSDSRLVTFGYSWRDVTLESSAFAGRSDQTALPPQQDALKLRSRITRLSFQATPSLSLQLSRGTLSGLDQLVHNGEVRRNVMSATLTRPFKGGAWQTTVAWGRNARKKHETTTGYLAETTVRFGGSHLGFGRLEQVGSDTLHFNDPLFRRPGKINKFSVGYFRDLHRRGSTHLGIGAMASRHLLSDSQEAAYGSDPTSYMLFIRLKL